MGRLNQVDQTLNSERFNKHKHLRKMLQINNSKLQKQIGKKFSRVASKSDIASDLALWMVNEGEQNETGNNFGLSIMNQNIMQMMLK
jgi:hypothetical protein